MPVDLLSEVNFLKEQIVSKYSPSRIILFGSFAKGTASSKSDMDLCIVKNTDNKRELLTDMYVNLESNRPFDLLVYTEKEWNECVEDSTSFANLVSRKGLLVYGR